MPQSMLTTLLPHKTEVGSKISIGHETEIGSGLSSEAWEAAWAQRDAARIRAGRTRMISVRAPCSRTSLAYLPRYLSREHTTAATLGAVVLKPAGCVTSAPDQAVGPACM